MPESQLNGAGATTSELSLAGNEISAEDQPEHMPDSSSSFDMGTWQEPEEFLAVDRVEPCTFEYLGSADYDASHNIEIYGENAGNVTYWMRANYIEQTDPDMSMHHGFWPTFDPPTDFDYDHYTLLVSFGRRIADLGFVASTHDGDGPMPLSAGYGKDGYLVVTYDQDYQGNKVFFYKIEKRDYDESFGFSPCYIMYEGKHVYLGLSADSYFDTPFTQL